MLRILAIVICAALSACANSAEKMGQDAPGAEGPRGWFNTESTGETRATWRAGPNAVEFSLICTQADKMLIVHAEAPAQRITQNLGMIMIGVSGFSAEVTAVPDSLQIQLATGVTSTLLKALAAEKTARIVIGDDFTATEPDDTNALARLSRSCAALTGVKLN
ncbi:MAG: hypothetical protein ABWZ40_11495 [Caulobacterales bacterium]